MRHLYPVISLLILTSCSGGGSVGRSEQGIADFHRQLNSGDYAAIYAAAAPQFRAITDTTDFTKFISAVHDKLGPFEHGAKVGWRVNYNTAGNNIVTQYKSHFAKGDAEETFIFNTDKPMPKMIGNVNSPTLVTG